MWTTDQLLPGPTRERSHHGTPLDTKPVTLSHVRTPTLSHPPRYCPHGLGGRWGAGGQGSSSSASSQAEHPFENRPDAHPSPERSRQRYRQRNQSRHRPLPAPRPPRGQAATPMSGQRVTHRPRLT